MAYTQTKYSAIPQGKVYMATRNTSGQTGGFTHVGDCDLSRITTSQQFTDIQESMSGNRANVAHILTQTDVSFELALLSIDGANLARAFYGDAVAHAAGTVTGEAVKAYAGTMSALKYPGVSAVVVKKGATTLVAGTDYELDAANGTLTFLPGSTQVTGTSAVDLTVDYSHGGYASKVKALTSGQKEYIIRVESKSKFDDKVQNVTLHRVALNTAGAYDLISTGVNKLTLNGKLLAAPEISETDADFSQYFTTVQK